MSTDEILEKLKAIAVEVLKVDPDKVVPEARFKEDLEADSLDLVEFTMACEEAFEITIEESELTGIETVGQVIDLIVGKL